MYVICWWGGGSGCCLHISIQEFEARFGRISPSSPWGEALWDGMREELVGYLRAHPKYAWYKWVPGFFKVPGNFSKHNAQARLMSFSFSLPPFVFLAPLPPHCPPHFEREPVPSPSPHVGAAVRYGYGYGK